VLCILPPAAALATAERVAAALRATGARPLYVDCNAIAPGTMRAVADTILAAGGRVADAGIIGGPPAANRSGTHIYSSGPGAAEFAALAAHGLDIRVLDGEIGRASALKMCYGAMTKGLQALGVELLVAAERLGVADALRAEQSGSLAEVLGFLERSVPSMPPKAYRWVGEMEEIAACFEETGLTPRLFLGAADLYRFVAATPLGRETPEGRDRSRGLNGVVAELAGALAEPAEAR
jgi:3-hydroxyisobutyrate dehydrogenase-like beta-hydroxyacid dehydrogenase